MNKDKHTSNNRINKEYITNNEASSEEEEPPENLIIKTLKTLGDQIKLLTRNEKMHAKEKRHATTKNNDMDKINKCKNNKDKRTREETKWTTVSKRKSWHKTDEDTGLSGNERRPARMTRPKWTIPRPDAIVVKVKDQEEFKNRYTEITKKLENPDAIKRIRKTRTGQLLFELESKEDIEKIKNQMMKTVPEDQVIQVLQKSFDLEIRDLDPVTEKEDILLALQREFNIGREEMFVKALRSTKIGTQMAVVDMPLKYLKTIMDKSKIIIGFTKIKLTPAPKIIKCYKCHLMGHYSTNCTTKIKENTVRCRKCNKDGHIRE